jgi:hypothetical protein
MTRKLPGGLDISGFEATGEDARQLAAAFMKFAIVTGNLSDPLHALVEFWKDQEFSEIDAEPLGVIPEPQQVSRFSLLELE